MPSLRARITISNIYRIGLIILIITLSKHISAQRTFSRMYDLLGVWESAATVVHYNDGLIVLSGMGKNFGVSDSTQFRKTFIWTIDSNLNAHVKFKLGNNRNDFSGMVALKSPNNSSNLCVALNNDTIGYYLITVNEQGDTIKSALIDAPSDFSSITWILKGDKVYAFGKDLNDRTTLSNTRILCFDTSGKKVWYKKFTKPYHIINVIATNDNYFLVSGTFIKGEMLNDTSVGWYAKMDTLGNFVWEKFLDKKDKYKAPGVLLAKLGNHYYVAGSNDGSDIYFPATVKDTCFLYLFEIDNDGNPLWYKRTYTSPWSRYVFAGDYIEKNGYIYARGNLETTEGWAGTTTYLTLLKFDSLGNMLWQRLFKQWYRDNRGYSLTPVYNGFIICADGKDTTHTTGITDAWVIKTDTNGCVVPGCHLKDGLVQLLNPEDFIMVYPNPANDVINISVIDARAKLANVFIYDMSGNEQKKQPMKLTSGSCAIQTHGLTSGNYFIIIELKSGERAVKKIFIQRD